MPATLNIRDQTYNKTTSLRYFLIVFSLGEDSEIGPQEKQIIVDYCFCYELKHDRVDACESRIGPRRIR